MATETKKKSAREIIADQLEENGLPRELADALPESLIKVLGTDNAKMFAIEVPAEPSKDSRDSLRIELIDGEGTREEDKLGEIGLANISMLLSLLCYWMGGNKSAYRSFRHWMQRKLTELAEQTGDETPVSISEGVLGASQNMYSWLGRHLRQPGEVDDD